MFKHRFDLAFDLITKYQADGKQLNSNGASLLHILFANYDKDLKNNERLALLLIETCELDVNLGDNDNKTPLHVAINKSQQKALKFAFNYNKLGAE